MQNIPTMYAMTKEQYPQQFPYYPPTDNEIRYDEQLSQVKLNPQSIEKQVKFCPICDFPIVVRVVLFPCKHFMCYECYVMKGSTFCKTCNEAINQFHRLPDNAKFYSCDLESCSKYFENELDYLNHVKLHDLMSTVK